MSAAKCGNWLPTRDPAGRGFGDYFPKVKSAGQPAIAALAEGPQPESGEPGSASGTLHTAADAARAVDLAKEITWGVMADRMILTRARRHRFRMATVVTEFSALLPSPIDLPTPGYGEALVKLETSGVCHTELHAAQGDWPVKSQPPFVPGHEGYGTVVAVGEVVNDLKIGDKVGNAWLWSACGRSEYCLTGWETLCERQKNGGYSVDGSFGTYMLVNADYAARIPDGADPLEVAPILCAGVTVYKALKVTETRPCQWVAISGIGGLGHIAVRACDGNAGGCRRYRRRKLALAMKLGAEVAVNAHCTDAVAEGQQITGGTHGVLVTAVHPQAFGQAIGLARRGGTIVFVGLPRATSPHRSSTLS